MVSVCAFSLQVDLKDLLEPLHLNFCTNGNVAQDNTTPASVTMEPVTTDQATTTDLATTTDVASPVPVTTVQPPDNGNALRDA